MPNKSNPNPAVDLDALQAALTTSFKDNWRAALAVFEPLGVANTQQVQRAAALSRDQVNRLMEKFTELAGPTILARVKDDISQPGQRGRAPAVYRLGETGAALLRRHGYAQAQLCNLKDATAIMHALATLDVRLAAQAATLKVLTEQQLSYGDGQVLRPDNLVTLPSGVETLFETEQAASYGTFRRILSSVEHKAAFFKATRGQPTSSHVRVLFNLPRGKTWENTLALWEKAMMAVAEQQGGQLPFRLWALPLQEFLKQPDWADVPDAQCWICLFDPAKLSTFAPTTDDDEEAAPQSAPAKSRANPPQQLRRRSPAEDTLILKAYWQFFREKAPQKFQNAVRPDPNFFALMELMYVASHDERHNAAQQAAVPTASLYLLERYLKMHQPLHEALSKSLTRGGTSMRWNPTTILHRLQATVDVFLRYHGLVAGRALQVYASAPDWEQAAPRRFGVTTKIHPDLLRHPHDEHRPSTALAEASAQALAWVLEALFVYAEDVGLPRLAFW